MFDLHPYMHEEIGEIEGKDKYKEGMDIISDWYINATNVDLEKPEEPEDVENIEGPDTEDDTYVEEDIEKY